METPRSFEDLQLAVKYGVQLLDERYPAWHQAIDLEHLDMASSPSCVLGQMGLGAGYTRMLENLDIEDRPETYGFDAESYDEMDDPYRVHAIREDEYQTLKDIWTKVIEERRS